MVEARKREVLEDWYNKQRGFIKEEIEEYYNQSFNSFNEAVDKTFIDYGKSNYNYFNGNVRDLKHNHINTNKQYKARNTVNIRELHHLNYRKQEILNGNINNSIFTFSEIYGGVLLKDIKDINGINSNWNIINGFLDTNLPTEQNAKYHSEELGDLDDKFDSFMLSLQRKFYDNDLNPGQRLFLEQFSINLLKAYRANPNAFGVPNLPLNLNIPDGLGKGLLVPTGNQSVLQNYLWGYSKRSVFDPNYYLKVLDEILINNGYQPVFGDVSRINFYIRSAYIAIAQAQANERRNNAFNDLINSSTTEDILIDLFVTALGERNNTFLDARPGLREEVKKYFKANNRSQYSHDGINWLLNQYQDNNVFPVNADLFKSKSTPLFQDNNNPNRAIQIDFIPQAVTEGITNFGNVLAELFKDNEHLSFEGSLIKTIFTVNGLNIHSSILNDWFGFNFQFIPNNGQSIQINFENGNTGYGTAPLKDWFLDIDNDGYHARGSSPRKLENSPGSGWVEGISQGEDCDDNDNLLRSNCSFKILETQNVSGINKTKHTFSNASVGELKIKIVGELTGEADLTVLSNLMSKVTFSIDSVGSSSVNVNITSITSSLVGTKFESIIVFTGLPDKNDGFGKKEIKMYYNGVFKSKKDIKVFFNRDGNNNPNLTGSVPNWFYYWKEGNVCGIPLSATYDSTADFGYTQPGVNNILVLGPSAATTNTGPETFNSSTSYGSLTVTGTGDGIYCVAETVAHELHHLTIYNNLGSLSDSDGDGVANTLEGSSTGVNSNPNDSDTYKMSLTYPGYATYGDNEIRCRKIELNHGINVYSNKDWSNPGTQY